MGLSRATLDVDVTVWVSDAMIDTVVDRLAEVFRSQVEGPAEFVRRHRVLPLTHLNGVRLDVIFGLLPFEETAIQQAVTREIGVQDVRQDAEEVVRRRVAELDREYLDPRIRELADLLQRPAIWDDYQSWLADG